MNYLEWSKEYEKTAAQLDAVLQRLKNERACCGISQKKELSDKMTLYRQYKRECMETANHLMKRHRGEA